MNVVRMNSNSSLYLERPDLIGAAASGVRDVMILQGLQPALLSGGLDTSRVLDVFEEDSFNRGRQQLDVVRYADQLVRYTDVGEGDSDYVLTDQDIFAPETNFVFGVTWGETTQLSIQSVARFLRSTRDRKLQGELITHVARHEYAHMAGLLENQDFVNPDGRGGIYEGYCADLCTMQQVVSVEEVIAQVQRLDGHELAGFCMNCIDMLDRKARNR